MNLDDSQVDAAHRVSDLITQLQTELGPFEDDDPEEDMVSGEDMADGWAVGDWVLVVNWTSLRTGECFTTRITPPGTSMTTRTGLLHEALYGMG